MQQGIYFRSRTSEVTAVTDETDTLPGAGWERVAEDTRLGLVAVRHLLIERGLVDAEGAIPVYWRMVRHAGEVKRLVQAAA